MIRETSIAAIGHIPHYSKIFLKALRTPLLLFIATLGNVLLLLSAVAFYYVEEALNPNVGNLFDAIWWAFSTVSTVGYGDITPVTLEGRLIGIFLMITGVTLFVGFTAAFVSVISALTAKRIVKGKELTYQEHKKVMEELKTLHQKFDALQGKSSQ